MPDRVTLEHLKDYQAARSEQVGARAINLELRILVNVLNEANLWDPISKHYKPLTERPSDIARP